MRGLDSTTHLGLSRRNSAATLWNASRSTLPERLSSASPIFTRPSPIPTPALSWLFAAATDRTTCSTISTFDVIAAHPKPFFAYSDLTGIQLRLLDELGLPAFHGPMLAADFYLEDGVHLRKLSRRAGRRTLQRRRR